MVATHRRRLFQHVPKAAILEAVGEFAPESVNRLAKLKKADIAGEAERLADGTGWMPAIFAAEATQQAAQEVVTDEAAEVQEEAAAAADEQPQARHWPRDLAPQIAPRFTRPGRFMPRFPMSHNTTNRPRMAATYTPARYAPAAGMAMATCVATARLAAG